MKIDATLEQLYLRDQIGPGHEAYEELKRRFENTADGKRIEEFRAENAQYNDGLNTYNPTQLDTVLRSEDIQFHGKAADRIAKIRAIRKHREDVEREKIRKMTPDERKFYVETKNENLAKILAKQAEDQRLEIERVQRVSEERQKKMNSLEELRAKRYTERMAMIEENRKMLDKIDPLKKADPTALKKKVLKEVEDEEKPEVKKVKRGRPKKSSK